MKRLKHSIIFVILLISFQETTCLLCGDPGQLNNGTRTVTHFNTGGIVRYKCDDCFYRSGAKLIQCTQWGHWTSTPPICVLRTCPSITQRNGKVLKKRHVGYVYHFACLNNLIIKGPESIECLCNGKWNKRPPICVRLRKTTTTTTKGPVTTTVTPKQRMNCPNPELKLAQGYIFPVRKHQFGTFLPGDRIYYVCKPRRRIIGPNVRVCRPDMEWSGYHPTCLSVNGTGYLYQEIPPNIYLVNRCTKFFPPNNGRMVGGDRVGQKLVFYCDRGYKLNGANEITCQRNGKWTEYPPLCKPACQDFKCPLGKECKLNDLMEPFCECASPLSCPATYKPICASDAITYNNECMMKAAACRANATRKVVKEGTCKPAGVCHISPQGKCKGRFSVYHYEKKVGKCVNEDVGGCQKDGWNGYASLEECEKDCKDVCKKKADRGPCYTASMRWAYIPSAGDCRRFIYGGCFGNSNNFETYKQCKDFCAVGIDQTSTTAIVQV